MVLLTKALAVEYDHTGLRVNALRHDRHGDHQRLRAPEGGNFKLVSIIPVLGACAPEEIAGLFAYIASDEARNMTGSIVPLDGGITA